MEATEVQATAERAALDSVEDTAASGSARKDSTANGVSKSTSFPNGTAQDDDTASDAAHDDDAGDSDGGEFGDAGEMSFVIDTAGDMDVDREIALGDDAVERSETHLEGGLLLPSHVGVIAPPPTTTSTATSSSNAAALPQPDAIIISDDDSDAGYIEQLDLDPATASRYYGAEEKAERRAREVCLACGETGHDRRHCPHQHCLACGAMDDHPTRFCPMSTSCFRCGGMGHQTRTCPKPRRAGRQDECERCGSVTHVKALCPSLWRVYSYRSVDGVDRWRAKMFWVLSKGGVRGMQPDGEVVEDSEDEFVGAGEPQLPDREFDPATRWCYNCSSSSHWGDDCPEPRCNPTRGTGEPSAFSEFVSRLGPYGRLVGPAKVGKGGIQGMEGKQFTFRVGGGAEMYVSSESTGGARKGVAIGKHTISGPSRAGEERMVSFDRTKAVAVEGGFLTPKEKKKGKKPLPEHLFKQWVRDRHDHPEYAVEIRRALERRAELEAQGLDASDVPSTRDIVGGKRSKSKRRRGGTAADPVVIDTDDESYRDDFSDEEDEEEGGRRRRKRRGDGKNGKWEHDGDGKGGRGSNRDSSKGFKGGRFSGKRQEEKGLEGRIGGESGAGAAKKKKKKAGKKGKGGESGGKGKGGGIGGKSKGGGGGGAGGGSGGEKVRGGGSKYRGSYF